MTWYEQLSDPKAHDEAAFIVQEFAGHGIDIGGVPAEGGGIAYMFAMGQLLAREQYQEQIQAVVDRRAEISVARRVIRDIVLLNVTLSTEYDDGSAERDDSAAEGSGDREPPDNGSREQRALLRFIDEIDAALGPGIATLNHLLTVSPGGTPTPCPATEPQEVYGDPEPFPPKCQGTGGARVRIYVADTGVLANTVASCSWLSGVSGQNDPRIEPDGTIMHYGGHGTFVAGVIRCLAPGAEIVVDNVFNIAGSALEADFVPRLHSGFGYGAEIFHLTVASPTRHNLPLMAFEAWLEDLRQHKGVICVVAAGNNGDRRPCWPAAFSGVLSVGALGTDWRSRAYFSCFGGWVDVYAPGQNLVNAFATGPYVCQVAPYAGERRTFSGMAQWSGTSFSTPIVTGLIAARMTRCGESGREAATALLAQARAQAIPGVGAVLYPGCDNDDCCENEDRGGGRCGCGGTRCGCGGTRCGCGGTRCGCGGTRCGRTDTRCGGGGGCGGGCGGQGHGRKVR